MRINLGHGTVACVGDEKLLLPNCLTFSLLSLAEKYSIFHSRRKVCCKSLLPHHFSKEFQIGSFHAGSRLLMSFHVNDCEQFSCVLGKIAQSGGLFQGKQPQGQSAVKAFLSGGLMETQLMKSLISQLPIIN